MGHPTDMGHLPSKTILRTHALGALAGRVPGEPHSMRRAREFAAVVRYLITKGGYRFGPMRRLGYAEEERTFSLGIKTTVIRFWLTLAVDVLEDLERNFLRKYGRPPTQAELFRWVTSRGLENIAPPLVAAACTNGQIPLLPARWSPQVYENHAFLPAKDLGWPWFTTEQLECLRRGIGECLHCRTPSP